MLNRTGNKNPNWRGGKTKCDNCNKFLSQRYSWRPGIHRCRKCWLLLPKKGKQSHLWKGGGNFCKCDKKIDFYAKQCQSCHFKNFRGENHPAFKQKLTNYRYIHMVMIKIHGKPKKCEHCGKLGKMINNRWNIHWANKSGKYLRDRSDWLHLCVHCHRKFDI